MENVVIELTLNKWMLFTMVIAALASLVSNMLGIWLHYLKNKLEVEKSKHENSGLHLQRVSESKWLIEYQDSDKTTAYTVQKADSKENAVKYFKDDFGDLWITDVNEITYSR